MLSLFGFGKKRRRVSSRGKKLVRKPPARLLRICKKYHVKSTKKVGRRRVYKPAKVLAKQCLRKAKMMKRGRKMVHRRRGRKMVHRRRGRKMVHRRRRVRAPMMGRSRFGESSINPKIMSSSTPYPMPPPMKPPVPPPMPSMMMPIRGMSLEELCKNQNMHLLSFGKHRRRGRKMIHRRRRRVSKASAMKAFRKYYRRNFGAMRSTRFGNGGNPPLWHSMGYEFCPSGMGGVLGANSTGLFPSPCTSLNSAQAKAEAAVALPSYSSSYGRRSRRRRSNAIGENAMSNVRYTGLGGARRRRRSNMGNTMKQRSKFGEEEDLLMKQQMNSFGGEDVVMAHKRNRAAPLSRFGRSRTRSITSTAIGRRRRKSTTAIGSRRRKSTTAIGSRRHKKRKAVRRCY